MPLRLYSDGSPAWKRELGRKAFHQLVLLFLGAYHLLGWPTVLRATAVFLAVWTALETARLRSPAARQLAQRWFGGMIREKEAGRFSGAFFSSLGALLTFALFGDKPAVVTASFLVLAWGDAASPLVGLRFGWKPYTVAGTRRSVDGTLAGFAVALGVGLWLGFPWPAAALAAAAFSVVDTYPVKPDDNVWIPVVYGAVLRLFA